MLDDLAQGPQYLFVQPSDIICTSLSPPVAEEPFRRELHLSKHQIGMSYTRAEPYLATGLMRPCRRHTYIECDLVDCVFIWGCLINWTRDLSLCNQSGGDLFQPHSRRKARSPILLQPNENCLFV